MQIQIRALPGGEPAPHPTQTIVVADEPHAFPCRRCMTDAEPGERLLLLPYDPFPSQSPYTAQGPIFVHADGCQAFRQNGELPAQLQRRLLAIRAYDANAMMVASDVVDGTFLEGAAQRLLDVPGAAYAHVHYARAGCLACRVETD
jgi:hypothetical protein